MQYNVVLYSETIRLNVFENYLNLVINIKKYLSCTVGKCVHCGKFCGQDRNYYRHYKRVQPLFVKFFLGIFFKNSAMTFKKIKEFDISGTKNNRFYPFYAWSDFKYYFPKGTPENGPKQYLNLIISFSSAGITAENLPDFEGGACFVTNEDENQLDKNCLTIRIVYQMLYINYQTSNSIMCLKPWRQAKMQETKLAEEFEACYLQLNAIGFNSASYKMNLIKPDSVVRLTSSLKNNCFCIKTNKLRFSSVHHFLAL